jgi:hypothetical protein
MLEATRQTCDAYKRMADIGGDPSEIVTGLAAHFHVTRPSIWRRLRIGGVLPPYGTRGPLRKKRRPNREIKQDKDCQPRVDRDPCQRCGVRHDIGCNHSRAPLGMTL